MREFKTSPFGHIVDLDSDETYDYLPKTVSELQNYMMKSIGYAYCYFKYLRNPWDKAQEERVEKLIKEFCDDWYNTDIKVLRERCFMFDDETENMC